MESAPVSKALAQSQGVISITAATFNVGCGQAVKNKAKLERTEKDMNQLLVKSSIVCLQEADGVFDKLAEDCRSCRNTRLPTHSLL